MILQNARQRAVICPESVLITCHHKTGDACGRKRKQSTSGRWDIADEERRFSEQSTSYRGRGDL